ncbi:MAG: hypothetical protein ACJAR2_002917 [Ilumatobacter sp.]
MSVWNELGGGAVRPTFETTLRSGNRSTGGEHEGTELLQKSHEVSAVDVWFAQHDDAVVGEQRS